MFRQKKCWLRFLVSKKKQKKNKKKTKQNKKQKTAKVLNGLKK